MKQGRDTGEMDFVAHMAQQWLAERPDLNMEGLEVIGRISRLARYFEREIEPSLATYGLNGPSFYVLASLRRSGPPYRLSPTELYSSLLVSSGTMTHRLDRLEDAGLINRVPDPADGRSSLVALTNSGRNLIDRAMNGHTDFETRMLEGLSARDRHDLADRLRRLLVIAGDRPEVGASIGRLGQRRNRSASETARTSRPVSGPVSPS